MNFNYKKIDKNSILEPFSSDIKYITRTIESNKGECYLVGGSVRDLVMGFQPDEYDLTTSLEPEVIKSLFKRVIETGIKHGTVTILIEKRSYEITTYRKDIDYLDGRRPEKIQFCSSLSEDLSRRDFTINAMAFNLIHEEFIDLHNAWKDLQNQLIQTIGNPIDRFTEDGLRAIRAIRFVGKLNFRLEENTQKAIAKTNHITRKVSVERFHDELNKIFFTKAAEKSLELILEEKIFQLFLPEIEFKKLTQTSFLNIHFLPKSVPIRLCFFLFLALKKIDMEKIERDLKKLKYSNLNIKETLFYIKILKETEDFEEINSYSVLKKILSPIASFFAKYNGSFDVKPYLELRKAILGENEILNEMLNNVLKKEFPLLVSDLKINGRIVLQNFPNIKPNKIGEILNHCLDVCFRFPEKNQETELLKIASDYIQQKSHA